MLICTYPGRFLQVVSLENKNNRICKQNTTRHTQNRTNTQQQNELRRPTLQQLCPLSPWVGQRRYNVLAPQFTMGPLQGHDVRIALTTVGSFVWANEFNPSKN